MTAPPQVSPLGDRRPTHGVDVTGEPLERGIASLETHGRYLAGLPGRPPPRAVLTGSTALQGRAEPPEEPPESRREDLAVHDGQLPTLS